MTKPHHSLKALTTAALAIPGMTQHSYAAGTSPVEDIESNYRYSYYHENGNRYNINVYETDFAVPIDERIDLNIGVGRDIMTGASPVFYTPSFVVPGQVDETRSEASISDERNYIDIAGNYYLDNSQYTLGAAYSSENDYESVNINTEGQWHFNKKNTTLTAGLSLSDDKIRPVDEIDRLDRLVRSGGDKNTQEYSIGITQTIDKNSIIKHNIQYNIDTGYLDDPYKRVFIFGAPFPLKDGSFLFVNPDTRPGRRESWSFLTRYVRYLPTWESSLHVDYRFHYNDWLIRSHMLEASLHQPVGDGWELVPSLRYYTQTHAEFYSLIFNAPRADGFHSSDYRLAAYGSFSGGVILQKEFSSTISANIAAHYEARHKDYKLGGKAGPQGYEDKDFTKLNTSTLAAGLRITF